MLLLKKSDEHTYIRLLSSAKVSYNFQIFSAAAFAQQFQHW